MSFILDGGQYEWKLTNGASEYGKAHFADGSLSDGLYDVLSVGNVIARQLKLTLWNVSLDTSEPVVLTLLKTDPDATVPTSVAKGTYFIDTYDTSPYSEYADIVAYDALLKAEAPFMTTGEWAATTDAALAAEIATRIGVTLNANTASMLNSSPKTINQTPNIGPNGTTIREMLSVVGVMRGGNWIINDDNELELITLLGKYDVARVVTIDANGDFELVPYGLLQGSDEVVSIDANGDFQVIAFSSVTTSTELWYVDGDGNDYSDTWANIQTLAPIPYPAVTIGDEVVDLDVSPTETIKRIEVWSGARNVYRSPSGLSEADWEAIGGTILSASMIIMASQAVADDLYTQYNNFTYLPHKAIDVYADPELPLGTQLTIKNDTVMLSKRELNIDLLAACNISAATLQGAISYYPYLSPVERSLSADINQNRTAIEVNQSDITSIVQTFNEEMGVNIAELTSHSPSDVYDASTNPNAYWMYSIATPVNVIGSWVTQLDNGWYHIEGTSTTSSPKCIRFEPKAIASLNADTLTLLMEIKNASYTGTIGFASAQLASTGTLLRQYTINASYSDCQNPTDGKYYFTLNKNTSEQVKKALFAFGTDSISQGEGMNLDIRLSLYVGAYDGDYVPWSANSYNSRVQQTADGILISLASKITEAEAQTLVDNYGQVVEQYLRFANGVLELGESNSQFKALLDNTELAFTGADGRKVAWISNSQLYISEAVLNGTLTIRANASATTSWRQYVREADNIFCVKVVKPNA